MLNQGDTLAFVRVALADGTPPFVDLPGGAIDPGESPQAALVREFAEETGLCVEAGEVFASASQYFVTSKGEAVNNLCRFMTVKVTPGEARKSEDDHELIWLDPHVAIGLLRHDAHAWGVAAWIRSILSQA